MSNLDTLLKPGVKHDWETPQWLFNWIDSRWGPITLDPAASDLNAKCEQYYTKETNGLIHSWENQIVFVNPPYGRDVGIWIEKAHREAMTNQVRTIMLLPSRTDTKWFHNHILGCASQVILFRGRIKFVGALDPAPFPSMLIVYNGVDQVCRLSGMDLSLVENLFINQINFEDSYEK